MSDTSDIFISKGTAALADQFLLAAAQDTYNNQALYQAKTQAYGRVRVEFRALLDRFETAAKKVEQAADGLDVAHQPQPEDKSFTAPGTVTPLQAAEDYVVALRRGTVEMAESCAKLLIDSGYATAEKLSGLMAPDAAGKADAFKAAQAPTLARLCAPKA